MSSASRTVWLAFTPRDTVLVRDGRRFDAGVDATAEAIRPRPSTVAGAVSAAYGEDPEVVRAPVLARRPEQADRGWVAYFPAPADLVKGEGEGARVRRLLPKPSDVVTDLSERDLEWLTGEGLTGKGRPVDGWIPGPALARYLAGTLPPDRPGGAPERDLRRPGPPRPEPFAREDRVGLERTDGHTAKAGHLYQATHLRVRDGWAFLAECELPEDWGNRKAAGPVRLGGRARLVDVEQIAGVTWPAAPTTFSGGRVLVYLATPTLWPGGWRIPLPPGARLVAAAVGEPEPVATASTSKVRSPDGFWVSRVLRWAAPAGSVYLLRFDGGDGQTGEERAGRWAAGVHGRAYGQVEGDRLATAGFGVVLTGVWS